MLIYICVCVCVWLAWARGRSREVFLCAKNKVDVEMVESSKY